MLRLNEQTLNKLNTLVQLDIDAVQAYDHAMERIEEKNILIELEKFQADHERNLEELSRVVREHGGEPPEINQDLNSSSLESMNAIMNADDTETALNAMRSSEILTTRKYDDALSEDLPDDLRRLLSNSLEDEKRHLHFIERALDERLWEHSTTNQQYMAS